MDRTLDLSELIEAQKREKSYCVQCYMGKCGSGKGKCTNPLKGDAGFKKLVKYLNDPLLIPEVRKRVITENDKKIKEHLAFGEGCTPEILANGLIYTTCLFCYSKSGSGSGSGWNKCKNSKEGRCGKIDLGNGKYATFCYPDVKAVKHRIQIGLHINFLYLNQKDQISYNFLEDSVHVPAPIPTGTPQLAWEIEDLQRVAGTCPSQMAASRQLAWDPKDPASCSASHQTLLTKSSNTELEPVPEIFHQLRSENEELKAKIAKMADGLSIVKTHSTLSLSDDDKKSVNDRVMRENIALKAHIHLLMMAIQKMGINLASFGSSMGSFA